MRRLARHLFTLCSAMSLLLCVAVWVLVRSFYGADHFWLIYRSGGGDLLRCDAGDFTFHRSKSQMPDARVTRPARYEHKVGRDDHTLRPECER